MADLCVTWLLRYSRLRDRVHHLLRHSDSFASDCTMASRVKIKVRYLPTMLRMFVICVTSSGCDRNYFTFLDRSRRNRYFRDIIILASQASILSYMTEITGYLSLFLSSSHWNILFFLKNSTIFWKGKTLQKKNM